MRSPLVARLRYRRGVIAVDTEDPVKGETLLDEAVAWLGGRLDGPPECVHAFIDSCNKRKIRTGYLVGL